MPSNKRSRSELSGHDAELIPRADDDVPARRLLAHDLEAIFWDEDGEDPIPPPD